ncbi:MAG: hypothetical protein R6V75_06865 [Bacteroidales bacterium]
MVNSKLFGGMILLLAVASCRCDPPVVIDLGPVPDSILASVPYQNGMTYSFRHSVGQPILFGASRDSREEQTWCEWRCCEEVYKYQVVTTTLKPDYPVFDLTFVLTSQNNDHPGLYAWIGRSDFYIPLIPDERGWVTCSDSLLIGNRWYRDVLRIGRGNSGFLDGLIYPDTLYYNFSEVIIRITMSNDEYYEIDN